ncbi:putative cystine transporter YijE [Fundidesulfovibrio magnetotacticus]|uniref:Putative cystine transporter YijE n=1 Tax=Fundidesulfovibrio magnetotacticus TaxID=2730080 RepID=A0A6V8LYF8_9BACT|nr:DMT family transporter [Fundidesulfovibrio magnetotacticus]GFK95069.1 putative cystine transporter YijE [Fundidesulfovibrio magnetotacticus]
MTQPLQNSGKGDLHKLKADVLLLVTALIWGMAFVAQRVGMEHVGPFTFNGVRFAIGAAALLPLALRSGRSMRPAPGMQAPAWLGCLCAGAVLTLGASLQQIGLVYTTAGKAGFITCLYVILVPIFAAFLGGRTPLGTWLGALLAVWGMYLLSIGEDFSVNRGDLLELVGAAFWAGHVLVAAWFAPRMNPIHLAVGQYVVCSALSLCVALFLGESFAPAGLWDAAVPILYSGLLSVGVAYTLQLVAQRDADPSHAAIILSLESVFAALAGWALIGEVLSPRGMLGCGLMLGGMLLSETWPYLNRRGRGQTA